jgi:HEAT repeat protein
VHVLEKGESGMRRWAALALGIAARDVTDADRSAHLASAIRAASEREKNQDAVGAYWLASGLARDHAALPSIRHGLTECGNPRQRMYAATALALLGGDAATELLRTRVSEESQAMVRVAIAQSLGVLGCAGDVAPIFDTMMRLSEPELQGLAATAMATHGSADAMHALLELARLDTDSSVRRSAAVRGMPLRSPSATA